MPRSGIVLTGDWLLRRVATQSGLCVNGVLWIVDELWTAGTCSEDTLLGALQRWWHDRTVFLPDNDIALRWRRVLGVVEGLDASAPVSPVELERIPSLTAPLRCRT